MVEGWCWMKKLWSRFLFVRLRSAGERRNGGLIRADTFLSGGSSVLYESV
jgi:hypothetical protein